VIELVTFSEKSPCSARAPSRRQREAAHQRPEVAHQDAVGLEPAEARVEQRLLAGLADARRRDRDAERPRRARRATALPRPTSSIQSSSTSRSCGLERRRPARRRRSLSSLDTGRCRPGSEASGQVEVVPQAEAGCRRTPPSLSARSARSRPPARAAVSASAVAAVARAWPAVAVTTSGAPAWPRTVRATAIRPVGAGRHQPLGGAVLRGIRGHPHPGPDREPRQIGAGGAEAELPAPRADLDDAEDRAAVLVGLGVAGVEHHAQAGARGPGGAASGRAGARAAPSAIGAGRASGADAPTVSRSEDGGLRISVAVGASSPVARPLRSTPPR
jgi:hypothetical protein